MSLKPQTTRHRILGILTNESNSNSNNQRGNYQLVFSDTPGMLSPAYKLQETMQDTVSACIHTYIHTMLYIVCLSTDSRSSRRCRCDSASHRCLRRAFGRWTSDAEVENLIYRATFKNRNFISTNWQKRKSPKCCFNQTPN